MSEQEMREEIDRLRRELVNVRKERDDFRRSLCQLLPFDEVQWTEDDVQRLKREGVSIMDLLQEPEEQNQGSSVPVACKTMASPVNSIAS